MCVYICVRLCIYIYIHNWIMETEKNLKLWEQVLDQDL